MDENPYRSPESKPDGQRLRPSDLVAIIAGLVMVGSLTITTFTDSGSTIDRYASVAHDVAGLVMVVWTTWHFGPKLVHRARRRG